MIKFYMDNEKKNKYIDKLNSENLDNTAYMYSEVIKRLDKFEKYLNTSARNMTKKDFLEFLTWLSSPSLSTLFSYKSALINYLLFVTDRQYFTIGLMEVNNINQIDLIDCINIRTEAIKSLTENEYIEILNSNEGNWQDKSVVVLLWNRVQGENECSEILNLKVQDVDIFDKTINVNGRIVVLKDYEMNIVFEAIKEQTYIRTTIDKKGVIRKKEMKYIQGEYLIRNTLGRNNTKSNSNQCIYGTFANRMSKYYKIVLGKSGLSNDRIYISSVYFHVLKEYGGKISSKEFTDYLNEHSVNVSLSNFYREQDIMYNKMLNENLFSENIDYDIGKDEISNVMIDDILPTPYLGQPKEKNKSYKVANKKSYPRDMKVIINALKLANFKCEIDNTHLTFIRKKDNKPYTEPHHLIPLKYYDIFKFDIDIEENIVSLCSNCHNRLHYGSDIEGMLQILFERRKDLLQMCEIRIKFKELLKFYK